jgi:hypothetical protein
MPWREGGEGQHKIRRLSGAASTVVGRFGADGEVIRSIRSGSEGENIKSSA